MLHLAITNKIQRLKKFAPYFWVVLSLVFTIATLVFSAGYLVYRFTLEKEHQEKWKDYNDCGLA